MDRQELISIVVPVYNISVYLNRCVDSILVQTYSNIEIILIDDGSTDDSGRICDLYAEKDARVQVIHQRNRGLSSARNTGLDAMTGTYVMFVDSDDYIHPDMVEKLYQAVKTNDAQLGICNFQYVAENAAQQGKYDNKNLPIKDECISGEEVLKKKIFESKSWYWVVAVCKLYQKDIFSKERFDEGKLHEDEFILHRVMLQCKKVACVSDALYYYLQREGSIMHNANVSRLDSTEAYFLRAMDYCALSGFDYCVKKSIMQGLGRFYVYNLNTGYPGDDAHRKRSAQLQKLLRETCGQVKGHKIGMDLKTKCILWFNCISLCGCARLWGFSMSLLRRQRRPNQ